MRLAASLASDIRHDSSASPIATARPSADHLSTALKPQIERIVVLPANTYAIRHATHDDGWALRALAELDSQRPLSGPALIGAIGGCPSAAISLADGRVVADPFQLTVQLRQVLRIRAAALHAHERTPSLPERLRASIATVPAARATEA